MYLLTLFYLAVHRCSEMLRCSQVNQPADYVSFLEANLLIIEDEGVCIRPSLDDSF